MSGKPTLPTERRQGGPLGGLLSRLGSTRGRGRVRAGRGGLFYLPQLIPAIGLIVYGAVVIWSASLTISDASFPRHLFGIALGMVAAYLVWRYDYRALANMSKALLAIDVVLMLLPSVPGLSHSALGMTGWIRIPIIGFTFQPSEVAKLVTIYLMASLGAEYNGKIEHLRDYLKLCGMLAIPFILILRSPTWNRPHHPRDGRRHHHLLRCQEDLGHRDHRRHRGARRPRGCHVHVAGAPHLLKTYQLKRLIVFVDVRGPSGDGYNLAQAKIAVGSGGLLGKGIGNASQAGSGFLPEAHTDFVFALLAEEFGFVGSVLLLALFGAMIFATISLAQRVESPFGKLVLVGCVAMWSFQLLENVGMCIGIMPITGIPLPFISFGSSSMLAQCASIGMVQSVWRHRPKAA